MLKKRRNFSILLKDKFSLTFPVIAVSLICVFKSCMCHFIYQEEDEDRKGNKVVSASIERMAHPLAERLDVLMTILFSYIRDVCHVDGENTCSVTKLVVLLARKKHIRRVLSLCTVR